MQVPESKHFVPLPAPSFFFIRVGLVAQDSARHPCHHCRAVDWVLTSVLPHICFSYGEVEPFCPLWVLQLLVLAYGAEDEREFIGGLCPVLPFRSVEGNESPSSSSFSCFKYKSQLPIQVSTPPSRCNSSASGGGRGVGMCPGADGAGPESGAVLLQGSS